MQKRRGTTLRLIRTETRKAEPIDIETIKRLRENCRTSVETFVSTQETFIQRAMRELMEEISRVPR